MLGDFFIIMGKRMLPIMGKLLMVDKVTNGWEYLEYSRL